MGKKCRETAENRVKFRIFKIIINRINEVMKT